MLKFSQIDACLRALADPTRRAIVERLSQGPAAVSDLAQPFELTLAAVLQHLRVLEEAGVIASEKIGRVRTYRMAPGGLDGVADWIDRRRLPAERRLDRLGAFLAAMEPPAGSESAENEPAGNEPAKDEIKNEERDR